MGIEQDITDRDAAINAVVRDIKKCNELKDIWFKAVEKFGCDQDALTFMQARNRIFEGKSAMNHALESETNRAHVLALLTAEL